MANIIINGATYNGVSSIESPLAAGGGNAVFPDTSDADAVVGDVYTGKTCYVNGSKITGTSVASVPSKGFLPTAWDANGFPTTGVLNDMAAIPAYMFYSPAAGGHYTYLASITFGSAPTSIGNYTFSGCAALILSTFPSTVETIGDYAFNGCTVFAPSSLSSALTTIGQYAFQNCTSLALTSLPANLVGIGQYAFNGCSNLALTSLPSGVEAIANYAFQNCTSLAIPALPASLTSIGTLVFTGCSGLTEMKYGAGLASITSGLFRACTGLTKFYIPSSVTTITTSSYSTAPFYTCSSTLALYCEAASKPAGWGTYWDNYNNGVKLSVTWGVSEATYDAI